MLMKEPSILTKSTGICFKYANDAIPVPKSSSREAAPQLLELGDKLERVMQLGAGARFGNLKAQLVRRDRHGPKQPDGEIAEGIAGQRALRDV